MALEETSPNALKEGDAPKGSLTVAGANPVTVWFVVVVVVGNASAKLDPNGSLGAAFAVLNEGAPNGSEDASTEEAAFGIELGFELDPGGGGLDGGGGLLGAENR